MEYIQIEREKAGFDAMVAAYLLNPLKSDYTYEDVAREQLDLIIDEKTAQQMKVCYEAYTVYASAKKLEKRLLESGMDTLFREIEMPLVFTLYEMEKMGVKLTIIRSNEKGTFDLKDMEDAICPETKMVICTNGSNLTGNYIDIEKVGEMAHAHGLLFVVDASQTAGVFPIDVQRMHIDVLCFTGHKGLLGPQGVGGMYVKKGLSVRPLKSGGSGVQTYSRTHPEEMPTALEAGTLNGHGIAGLGAAIDYINEVGMDTIREKEQGFMRKFYEGVKDIPGIKIYGDFTTFDRCAIVTLNIGDYDSSEVSDELLTEYGISTRPGGHCAPLMHKALGSEGLIRASVSPFNSFLISYKKASFSTP